MNLLQNTKIFSMVESATGSTTLQSGKVLDMSGFDGVMWIANVAGNTNSTGGYAHLQHMHSDSTSTTDMVGSTSSTDMYVANATTTIGAVDNSVLVLDIYKPLKRYVSVIAGKDSTNAAEMGVVGIQYRNHKGPTTQISSTTFGVNASATRVAPTT